MASFSAWVSAATGQYCWVHDHARWVTRPGNAGLLGIPEDVQRLLVAPPSSHTPAGRRDVLLLAMDAGLIRVRGHGVTTTFEATLPFITVIEAVLPFVYQHLGPWMTCRFNRLDTGESWVERLGIILPSDGAPTVTPPLIQIHEPILHGKPIGDE